MKQIFFLHVVFLFMLFILDLRAKDIELLKMIENKLDSVSVLRKSQDPEKTKELVLGVAGRVLEGVPTEVLEASIRGKIIGDFCQRLEIPEDINEQLQDPTRLNSLILSFREGILASQKRSFQPLIPSEDQKQFSLLGQRFMKVYLRTTEEYAANVKGIAIKRMVWEFLADRYAHFGIADQPNIMWGPKIVSGIEFMDLAYERDSERFWFVFRWMRDSMIFKQQNLYLYFQYAANNLFIKPNTEGRGEWDRHFQSVQRITEAEMEKAVRKCLEGMTIDGVLYYDFGMSFPKLGELSVSAPKITDIDRDWIVFRSE